MNAPEQSYSRPWFRTGRFFHQQVIGGSPVDGWYLTLRGGDVEGPFTSRYQAVVTLKNLLKAYEEMGETGRRENAGQAV